jgi:hypothetical protein
VPSEAHELFITLIVCAYITTRFAAEQVQWNLILKKANAWAKKESETLGITADLLQIAKQYLTDKGL